MTYKTIITFAFLLFSITNVEGQNRLLLQHKTKLSKKKHLNLEREYHIYTFDKIYKREKIIGYTDSTISISSWTKIYKDSIHTYKSKKNIDFVYTETPSIYIRDTTIIAFDDIQFLKIDWFKNTRWLEPFAWIAIAAVFVVIVLPVMAIEDGSQGVKEWAMVEASLLAVSVPPLFLGTRKKTYNLMEKWTLKVE